MPHQANRARKYADAAHKAPFQAQFAGDGAKTQLAEYVLALIKAFDGDAGGVAPGDAGA
jgi:hypothetical protein